MPTLKSCLRKIKAAGFDTDTIDTAAMVAAGEENMFDYIDRVVDPLMIQHSDLNAARNRLMAAAAAVSPEQEAAVEEHFQDEAVLNTPEVVGPVEPTEQVRAGIARQSKAGLPKKAATQQPKTPKALEETIESNSISAFEKSIPLNGVAF